MGAAEWECSSTWLWLDFLPGEEPRLVHFDCPVAKTHTCTYQRAIDAPWIGYEAQRVGRPNKRWMTTDAWLALLARYVSLRHGGDDSLEDTTDVSIQGICHV